MSKKITEQQINSIFEAITDIALLNYYHKAIVKEDGDQLDAIAAGINMLADQIRHLNAERDKADEKIRQNELFLKNAQQIAKMGSYEIDIETGGIIWSDELYKIFNCDPHSFTPVMDSFISLLHPNYRKAMSNWIALSITGIKQEPIICQLADVSKKWVKVYGELVFNKEWKHVKEYITIQDITDSKKNEINLQTSLKEISDYKNKLQNQSNAINLSNAIIEYSLDGIILTANDNFLKMFGYSLNEIKGKNHDIFLKEEQAGKSDYIELWDQLKKGKFHSGRFERIRKDGQIIWIQGSYNPIFDSEGKILKVMIIVIDVSEQKKSEGEIIKLKQQFELILNTITDGIHGIDNAGNIIFENPASTRMLGWDLQELIGKSAHETIHHTRSDGSSYPKSECNIYATFLDGKVRHEINEIFWRKDGTSFPVEYTSAPLLNEKGEIHATIVTFRDITERKLSEDILQKTLKQVQDYKLALDESSIVAITNVKGIINYANDNFCKISGYSMDELIGQDHRIINSGYHSKEFFQDLWKTIANGEIWRGDMKNKSKDGTYYWVDTTITPFLNEKGKPYQYLAICFDITQRKLAKENLLKVNNELESFSYSVSHDLRAPLRAIISFTSILEEDYTSKLDNEAKRITNVIKTNTTKMGKLIDDLLAFSRLGRQKVSKTNINTNALVKEIIDEMFAENKKNIEWVIAALPDSKGDTNLIHQVWVNFISNAIKYSGKKENPRIEIGSFLKDGQQVFIVKDNGAGFNEQFNNKLFKVFQRLHSADEFEGTGIGLAIIEKIISKHGGSVWAEGEVNKGACFYFSLPIE